MPGPFRRSAAPLVATLLLAAAAAAAPAAKPAAAPVALAPGLFKALAWRSIGPANMGGRISDFAVVEKSPATFYVATATGGVFKTVNYGTTWSAVFDTEAVSSIGAVSVWQRNPNLVWVGTGEANSRNSSAWGRGIYRSDDAGGSWKCMGLEATSSIARIVCDPSDSNVVYVAALGRLWGENPERGVYKTSDGGRSWQRVLGPDAKTGAVDLVMDPTDPRTLYAALYARRRTPWSYTGESTTGGIFKTTDGGRSWTRLTAGLPQRTGRIGLCVYAKNPRVVYAVVESDQGGRLGDFEDASREGGVFRSDDAGATWRRLSPFAPRAFYFSQVRVQPDDSTRVYLLDTDMFISDDGGVTFRAGGAHNLHPDCHAMWVDPHDGRHVLMGTDGGVYQSFDRAANWDYLDNLPIGEFYDVAADMREPYYNVYGGLQDNQSWGGPSRTRLQVDDWQDDSRKGHGIMNDHWFVLGGGDGFHVAADPTNPDIVYYESQGGYLVRQDLESGLERNCRPSNGEGEPVFRFNWNTPFQISPHDPGVLWMGGQYLFRLYERGNKWERVSPDLTTHDGAKMTSGGSGAETYCTITTLCESPLVAGQVWVGTDDGKLWVTPDGGRTWNDLTANLKGLPPNLYVTCVEASHHDARTAYVSVDGHRSDVRAPYLFVTHDLGHSWAPLAAGLPAEAPVQVVREGLHNRDLLYVGTEHGIVMSLDGGRHWLPLKQGLPTVAVDDILIHPRDLDVIVGTHGRSLYVLDGTQAFEEWTPRALADTVTFFGPRPAWAWHERSIGGKFGQREFSAANPPFGAWLDYFLPREVEGGVSVAIADSAGHKLRTLKGPGEAGFHRLVWDLVAGEPKERIGRLEWNGQPEFVRPGRYKATLTCGRARPLERTFEVKAVPGTNPAGM